LSSIERICFQIEQAYWYYEDFAREQNSNLPYYNLKNFSAKYIFFCIKILNIIIFKIKKKKKILKKKKKKLSLTSLYFLDIVRYFKNIQINMKKLLMILLDIKLEFLFVGQLY